MEQVACKRKLEEACLRGEKPQEEQDTDSLFVQIHVLEDVMKDIEAQLAAKELEDLKRATMEELLSQGIENAETHADETVARYNKVLSTLYECYQRLVLLWRESVPDDVQDRGTQLREDYEHLQPEEEGEYERADEYLNTIRPVTLVDGKATFENNKQFVNERPDVYFLDIHDKEVDRFGIDDLDDADDDTRIQSPLKKAYRKALEFENKVLKTRKKTLRLRKMKQHDDEEEEELMSKTMRHRLPRQKLKKGAPIPDLIEYTSGDDSFSEDENVPRGHARPMRDTKTLIEASKQALAADDQIEDEPGLDDADEADPAAVAAPPEPEDLVSLEDDADGISSMSESEEVEEQGNEDQGGLPAKKVKKLTPAQLQDQEKVRVAKREKAFHDPGADCVVNVRRRPGQAPILLPSELAAIIKTHQIEGIRFLWDNLIDPVNGDAARGGAILAHGMGLGKTLQVCVACHSHFSLFLSLSFSLSFSFLYTSFLYTSFLSCTLLCSRGYRALRSCDVPRTLLLVINLMRRWQMSLVSSFCVLFLSYTTGERRSSAGGQNSWTTHTSFQKTLVRLVFLSMFFLFWSHLLFQGLQEKATLLKVWYQKGGIFIISYDTFRSLVEDRAKVLPKVTHKLRKYLERGPDVVIMDEAHLLSNQETKRNQAAMRIQTKARILLTGTPLQNSLNEYDADGVPLFVSLISCVCLYRFHSMIELIAPGYFGTRDQFERHFVNVIVQGLDTTSSEAEKFKAKRRLSVFARKTSGFVKRETSEGKNMTQKYDMQIQVRMSPEQHKLYQLVLERCSFFRLFALHKCLQRVWSWPPHLMNIVSFRKTQQKDGDVQVLEEDKDQEPTSLQPEKPEEPAPPQPQKPDQAKDARDQVRGVLSQALNNAPDRAGQQTHVPSQVLNQDENKELPTPQAIKRSEVRPELMEALDKWTAELSQSGKLIIALALIRASLLLGDKVIFFTESLGVIRLMREILAMMKEQVPTVNYSVITGKTKASDRTARCRKFNQDNKDLTIMLISINVCKKKALLILLHLFLCSCLFPLGWRNGPQPLWRQPCHPF